MPYIYEEWNVNPALNTAPPPVGAPEHGVQWKQVNDIIRRVMAGAREIADLYNATVATLGTMASQMADAVNITGGTITNASLPSSNSIDGAAIKTGIIPAARIPPTNASSIGGVTLQQLYNFIYPIGTVRLTRDDVTTYPVPPGVTATWAPIGTSGRYLRLVTNDAGYTGDENNFMLTGAASAATSVAGAHEHTGITGQFTLGIQHIPPHSHSVPEGKLQGGQATGYRSEATQQSSGPQTTGQVGGGLPHRHNIPMDGDHNHTVALEPLAITLVGWVRTS